jgi:hypothetical protein
LAEPILVSHVGSVVGFSPLSASDPRGSGLPGSRFFYTEQGKRTKPPRCSANEVAATRLDG